MIDTKKQYSIDGKNYLVARISEWYNDETTIEYWLYPGDVVRFGHLDSNEFYGSGKEIGIIDNLGNLEEDEDKMPSELAVKAVLERHNLRTLKPREAAEWLLIAVTEQEEQAARRVQWAKDHHERTRQLLPTATQRAEADVARAAQELKRAETTLEQLRVKKAAAYVQLQNG